MPKHTDLEQAIAAQEQLRGTVPDAVVDASIAALRQQLEALDTTAPDEQRRLVTVLFADLAGWTKMAEQMDPEDVQAIQRAYFAAVTPAIEQHGGAVEKYIGDAVLAVFGVPTAHEDDPERAVRAALAMQDAISDLNDSPPTSDLPTSDPLILRLRIGIHTGLVVSAVDADGDFVVTGDTVNLASRLESAAAPGAVLISEEIKKLVVHAFELDAVEPVHAKGKADLIPAFQVRSVKAQAAKLRGIAGLDSPLVGREIEFIALQQALNRLQRGIGGVITIAGEAGIGKSRLVAEARKSQIVTDLRSPTSDLWIEGRCLSFGATIPYLLWLDVLRSAMGVTLDDPQEAIRDQLQQWVENICSNRFNDVYPYLAHLMALPEQIEAEGKKASIVDFEELAGPELRQRTFGAVEIALACAAHQHPLVLVCEDLHWADPTSLELLESILPLVEQTPLLLICVMRARPTHNSWQLRQRIAQSFVDCHTDLPLQPLSVEDSEILVVNLLSFDVLSLVLRERILGRAEGNPFFVEEVIRALIDDGTLVQMDEEGWQITREVDTIAIPDTLQGVLAARIDRLQADTRHILQLASVIGRIFLYRVLTAIAEEERGLEGKLSVLQREELIRERARLPELEYIFKHALTQEAAYNGILKRQRRIFHRQVAEALERLFPERIEEMSGLLAHHWERSGNEEKAVEYLQRAGDQARLAYAHQESFDYYERALSILEAQGDQDRVARTWMKLGLTYHDAFQFQAAREAFDKATQLWHEAPPAASAAPAPHPLRLVNLSPRTLDPNFAYDEVSGAIVDHLFSGLIGWDHDWSLVPDVARSWQVLDGGQTYEFQLREDVTWSDGRPLIADDFSYAIQRLLEFDDPDRFAGMPFEIRSARAYHQGDITDFDRVGVLRPDPLTLRFELVQPASYFLHLLTQIFPVPRHVVERHGDNWINPKTMVCNGPFRLEAWQPEHQIVLRRNPRYHGRFPGNIEEVTMKLDYDFHNWLRLYEADEIDVIRLYQSMLGKSVVKRVRRRYAAEYRTEIDLGTVCIGFDATRSPFDDVRVRRAFGLAIDQETCNISSGGKDLPATGGFIPPGVPGHSPGIGLPYDPERARQLLANAGYPSGRGFPRLTALVLIAGVGILEAMTATWRSVLNVDVNWQGVDFAEFSDRLRDERPLIWGFGEGSEYPDPHSYSLADSYLAGWRNERYLSLLDQARRTTDQATRLDLYRQADRIVVDEVPILPLFHLVWALLVKPWIRRFPSERRNWHEVIIETH